MITVTNNELMKNAILNDEQSIKFLENTNLLLVRNSSEDDVLALEELGKRAGRLLHLYRYEFGCAKN